MQRLCAGSWDITFPVSATLYTKSIPKTNVERWRETSDSPKLDVGYCSWHTDKAHKSYPIFVAFFSINSGYAMRYMGTDLYCKKTKVVPICMLMQVYLHAVMYTSFHMLAKLCFFVYNNLYKNCVF